MFDRDQLETFATVAEEQSFERAATLLNITRGAVSQRIRALEETLATVLLRRERPVAPTPTGEVLLRHVKALRLLEGSTLREIAPTAGATNHVQISVAVNADSLATWFSGVLRQVQAERCVALEVIADDQDHTSGRLLRGEVTGCISTDAKAAAGFVAEPLGAMEYRCYANCDFARTFFPTGLAAKAVVSAPAVLFNRKDSLHDDFLKSYFGFAIDRYPKHYLPSPAALLDGIEMGLGYGLAPSQQAQPLAESGQLVDLASDKRVMVNLYWHHWDIEPPLAHQVSVLILREARLRLPAQEVRTTQIVEAVEAH